MWIEHNIDDTKPHVSVLLDKWDELREIPREEISLAITAIEEALLWLSK